LLWFTYTVRFVLLPVLVTVLVTDRDKVVDFDRVGDMVELRVKGRVVAIGERDRVLDGLRVRERDFDLVTETVPDFVGMLEGRTVTAADRERVKGRVVAIGERERVLDGLRVRETDLVLVTDTVPDFVGRLEGRTVTAADRERVKGRVVAIGERERVLDGLRVTERDLVLVTETVPDFVGRLEGRTVTAADGERVKGRVVGIPVRVRVTVTERVRETDLVLVTETVPDFVGRLEGRTVTAADRERVKGRLVAIGVRDRVLDGLRVRERDFDLVTETVPDFVGRLEGRIVVAADRERVKGRVVAIGVRDRVLDGLRVRERDLVLVTETVPDFVGRLEGRTVTAADLVIDIVPDFVGRLEGRTVTAADRERVKGRVVGMPVRERVLDGLRVRETDLVLVTDTVPDRVAKLEGRTVITADRERVKGRVVGIPVRDRVLDGLRVMETDLVLVTDTVPDFVAKLEERTVLAADRERVRETDLVLVKDTVTERVKGRVVGMPVRDRVTVTERVMETDLVLVNDTLPDRVATRVVGIPELVTVLDGLRVRETDLVFVKDTVTDSVALFVVGSADGDPVTLLVLETVTVTVTERVKGKLVGITVRDSVTVTDFE
jgi:hypothetical protein